MQLYAHSINDSNKTCTQSIGKANITCVHDLHILWTIPQYAFLGISEVLVGLTGDVIGFQIINNPAGKSLLKV